MTMAQGMRRLIDIKRIRMAFHFRLDRVLHKYHDDELKLPLQAALCMLKVPRGQYLPSSSSSSSSMIVMSNVDSDLEVRGD
jgi:hypothetical protein